MSLRSARRAFCLVALVVLIPAAAGAAESSRFSPSLRAIDAALERGELDFSAAARQKLYYLFARERLDDRFDLEDGRPARCGTLLLDELRREAERLDAETRALFESWSAGPAADPQMPPASVYQTTNFYIEYETSGAHAVPLADVSPANGVPDYVEKVGAACEFSRALQVGTLNYNAPPATSASQYSGKYLIQFQNQNSYGYTTVTSGTRTKIVLHPNYVGFPPNTDPEGQVLGAMKVTVAHELMHAIQRTYTLWTEGGWVELDATWMEDICYDDTNDYYNYISGAGSPFTEPYTPLDQDAFSVTGSYEDCNWQHYQSERLGNGHIRNFWLRRQANSSEAVMESYRQTLIGAGLSLEAAWNEYVSWNFASGGRATGGYGYGEAAAYPTTPITTMHSALPIPSTPGSTARLAATTHWIDNASGALGGTPEFTFSGNAATPWSVSVLLKESGGGLTRVPLTLTGGAQTLLLNGFDWADLEWAALVVGNAAVSGGSASYSFSARAIAPLHIAHQRPWNTTDTANPYPIKAVITAGTATPDLSSFTLVYRIDGGATQSLAMTATGNPNEYAANLPASPVGTLLEYRVEAQGTGGEPMANPARTGAFYPLEVVTVFEPFEAAGAWTVGAAGDNATTGIWTRVVPIGTAAQPGADYTLPPGDKCFVTGNGTVGGGIGEADVDGGKTTLLSPVYDLSAGGPYVSATARYRRWYSNELGAAVDDTWRVDVSNDGGGAWQPLEVVTDGSEEWVLVTDDLLARFGALDRLRFRFIAEDAGAGSIVEAAIDDFELIAVTQPAVAVGGRTPAGVRLGPAIPNPAAAALSWTLALPEAAPVRAFVADARGRVVRELLPRGATLPAGETRLVWQGADDGGRRAAAGVYFLRVVTPWGAADSKLTLLR